MFVTRHVEIPEPLMLAQEQGSLVVFVGAGASLAPPSSLPLFRGLAEAIAADTQSPCTAADLDEPSKFLGRLFDQGRPVHQRAHARVSASTVPNDIHKALVELFPSLETLRIVTTNWDRHLTAAAEAKFRRRPHVYTSPALPLGRDFSGIVHLHGSLNQEPEDLIMTEADFGRAYLTDAYCARFVYEMFRSYTVLFVGYSHKDPIMYHLGRGLPPKAEPRYGIINDEVPDDWRALRIIPIVYPSNGDHAALAEGLKAWAWLIQSGHLDYERRVQSLLASATMPPAAGLEEPSIAWDPADESFMLRVISTEKYVDLFTTYAQDDVRLLNWIQTTPPFRGLFDPATLPELVSREIGSWFANRFAARNSDAALAAIGRYGEILNPYTADLITAALARHRAGPQVVAQWLPVLLRNRAGARTLGMLLHSFDDDAYLNVGILLLDHLITSQGALDDYLLRQTWVRFFSPRIEAIAVTLVPLLERHLRTKNLFDRGNGSATPELDLDSLGRASIGTDPQNEPLDGLDLLIDATRDALAALGRVSPLHAQATADAWASDKIPVLRRIAVHCYGIRDDLSSDARIGWLIDAGVLYDRAALPEVYDLLAAQIPDARDVRGNLLDAVLAGPDAPMPTDHRHYLVMSLLDWLTRHATDFDEAKQALDELKLEHPEFTAAEHPNRFITTTMVMVGAQSPRSTEQLRQMTTVNDIAWLREYQGEAGLPEPNRMGLLWEVGQAAASDTAWSLIIAAGLADLGDWSTDLWPAIIRGWMQALPSTTDELLASMLGLLSNAAYPELFVQTADLLAAITARRDLSTEVVDLCELRATELWNAARDDEGAKLPVLVPDENRFFVWSAVEHWIGDLTVTFIQIAALRWLAGRETWVGLPATPRAALEELLAAIFVDQRAVLSVACRSLALLCALDDQWTAARIIPEFAWNRPEDPDQRRATVSWEGFLTHPALNERVLGLLQPHFADAFAGMTNGLRKAVANTMANIAIGSATHDGLIGDLVSVFIGKATDEERTDWAESVGWLLDRISAADSEAAWQTWIPAYWRQRQNGLPQTLSHSEIRQMLTWIPTAGEQLPTAVELLTSTDAEFDSAYLFFTKLAERLQLLADHPVDASKLVAFVLKHSHEQTPLCVQLGTIITTLAATHAEGISTYLEAACDDARRLGCIDAANWL